MRRRGEFNLRRYKVLILPQTEAIGLWEAQVIRDFAEGRGEVIADVRLSTCWSTGRVIVMNLDNGVV